MKGFATAGGGSVLLERAGKRGYEYGDNSYFQDMPVVNAKIGFQPNEAS
jgi:hypothetical protein